MYKFTLVSMAALCTLLISCSTQEFENDQQFDQEITTRSSGDYIKTAFIEAKSPVAFVSTNTSLMPSESGDVVINLEFANGGILATTGEDVNITASVGYNLKVTTDGVVTYTGPSLSVSFCGSSLCYTDGDGNSVTAIGSIIIDDEPLGI